MKLIFTLASFAAFTAGPAISGEHVVTMSGSDYSPSAISASLGDTILFINDDGTDHNVFVATAAHALDLGKQEPGSEAELVLRSLGSFEVECVFHPHMLLTVEVGS